MRLSKRKEIQIGQYTVTVDANDYERVAAQKWQPFLDGNRMTFINEQRQQLLAGFILGVPSVVYVEQIDPRKPWDYTRKNLRIHRAPAYKQRETRQR